MGKLHHVNFNVQANQPMSAGKAKYDMGALASGAVGLLVGSVLFMRLEGRDATNEGTAPVPPPSAHRYKIVDDSTGQTVLEFTGDQAEAIQAAAFTLNDDGVNDLLRHDGMDVRVHHPSGYNGTRPHTLHGSITDADGKVFEASFRIPKVD